MPPKENDKSIENNLDNQIMDSDGKLEAGWVRVPDNLPQPGLSGNRWANYGSDSDDDEGNTKKAASIKKMPFIAISVCNLKLSVNENYLVFSYVVLEAFVRYNMNYRRSGEVVTRRSAKPLCRGSIPLCASKLVN